MAIKRLCIIVISLCLGLAVMGQEVKKLKIGELEKLIAESRTPLIVNFWATFCKPCIEEIPYFEKLVEKYKQEGLSLLLVSLDMRDDYPKIRPFASKRKFSSRIVWLDESNADYFCPRIDEKWSGGIPATLLIYNKTGKRLFMEDQVTEERLEKEILSILAK